MRKFFDWLTPKPDVVQLCLKRRGEVESAVYKEGDLEHRSKSLGKVNEKSTTKP